MKLDKTIELIRKLHSLTKAGKIGWEKTPNGGSFQTVLAGYIIRAVEEEEESVPNEFNYILSLRNNRGDLVERIRDFQVQQEVNALTDQERAAKSLPGFSAFKLMKEIYEMARSSAMGSDKAIEDITKALDDLPPF